MAATADCVQLWVRCAMCYTHEALGVAHAASRQPLQPSRPWLWHRYFLAVTHKCIALAASGQGPEVLGHLDSDTLQNSIDVLYRVGKFQKPMECPSLLQHAGRVALAVLPECQDFLHLHGSSGRTAMIVMAELPSFQSASRVSQHKPESGQVRLIKNLGRLGSARR